MECRVGEHLLADNLQRLLVRRCSVGALNPQDLFSPWAGC